MTKTRSGLMDRPRLWSPTYDPMAVYIAHRPSGLCSDAFPDRKFSSFTDFYEQTKNVKVDPEAELYECEKLWHLPRRVSESGGQTRKRRFESTEDSKNHKDGTYPAVLQRVKLPPSCCIETPVAEPGIHLLLLFLPQFVVRFLLKKFDAVPVSPSHFLPIASHGVIHKSSQILAALSQHSTSFG